MWPYCCTILYSVCFELCFQLCLALLYCTVVDCKNLRMSIESSLRSDAWALKKISEYADGKVLAWSWVSRGLVSMEWIAKLHFDNDVETAKLAMSQMKGNLSAMCKLDELPIVDFAEDPKQSEACSALMEGEIFCFWSISDPDSDAPPTPLPQWMRGPIDKHILQWRQVASKWEEKIAKRAIEGKGLTPTMQTAYDDWQGNPTRSIVLDKTKRAEVVNIASKSIRTLKKTCILLVLHMSTDSNELKIATGNGKLWNLRLLEHHTNHSSDQVPAEVDHFKGLVWHS